jgi:hypothetical protein
MAPGGLAGALPQVVIGDTAPDALERCAAYRRLYPGIGVKPLIRAIERKPGDLNGISIGVISAAQSQKYA